TRKNALGCFDFASSPASTSLSAGSTLLIAVAIRTSIDAVEKLPVPFQKIEFAETQFGLPAKIVEDEIARLACKRRDAQKNQLERFLARIRVLVPDNLGAAADANRQLLFQLARQCL